MNGYTKLFGSIVASTIWREDDKTRIVWVTMLAMANKHGDVESSIPGLSDLARVSIQDVEQALKTLQEPDAYSRTKDYEGRRIAPIDGGWHILNHAKYRDKMSKDERRNYLTRKQAERRARLKAEADRVNNESTNVAVGQHPSTSVNVERDIAEADSEAKADTEPLAPPPSPRRGVVEGKGSAKIPTTDQSRRIATIFKRRHTTAWSDGEVRVYKTLGTIPEEDLALIEAYYSSDAQYLRHDLATFLNNFAGELDRARKWKREPKELFSSPQRPTMKL